MAEHLASRADQGPNRIVHIPYLTIVRIQGQLEEVQGWTTYLEKRFALSDEVTWHVRAIAHAIEQVHEEIEDQLGPEA